MKLRDGGGIDGYRCNRRGVCGCRSVLGNYQRKRCGGRGERIRAFECHQWLHPTKAEWECPKDDAVGSDDDVADKDDGLATFPHIGL